MSDLSPSPYAPCHFRLIAGHSNVVLRCEAHDWQRSYGYSVAFGYVGADATAHRQSASTAHPRPPHDLDSRCTVQGCPECDHAPPQVPSDA